MSKPRTVIKHVYFSQSSYLLRKLGSKTSKELKAEDKWSTY